MRVSIVVCTHNKSRYLRKALTSLTRLNFPSYQYEVLLVDNASTDDTREVSAQVASGIRNFTYLFEPRVGLNTARNRGWTTARGELVVFFDDDTLATTDWLTALWLCYNENRACGCIGGRVAPIWEVPRPIWLSDDLLPFLAIIDWGSARCRIEPPKFLVGANLAVPKNLLELVGGFEVGIDRQGTSLLSNGDVLIERQLQGKGFPSVYQPDMLVYHHVTAARLTKDWFYKRALWQGISAALMERRLGSRFDRKGIRSAIRVLAGLCRPKAMLSLARRHGDDQQFRNRCDLLGRLGYGLGRIRLVP